MTKRTVLLGPQHFASVYLSVVARLVTAARARHPELNAAVPVVLINAIGGGWALIEDDAVLDEGHDGELNEAAKRLALAAVSELDIRDRARLLARMQDRDDELPGAEPASFRLRTVVLGESWELRLSAHMRGSAVVVCSMSGTLLVVEQAA